MPDLLKGMGENIYMSPGGIARAFVSGDKRGMITADILELGTLFTYRGASFRITDRDVRDSDGTCSYLIEEVQGETKCT